MVVDYLIVGQGIAGTFLSYYLLKAGKRIMVFDEEAFPTPSKVASGVINPVTGRRIVKTWKIDDLLPFAETAYNEIGNGLGKQVHRSTSIIDFHPTLQMKEAFQMRTTEEPELLQPEEDDWSGFFNYYNGAGKINHCLLVDLPLLLSLWRSHLHSQSLIIDEKIDIKCLRFETNHVCYNEIRADKVIFCDGPYGAGNPFFKNLPFALNKGEALIVSIPGLPQSNIYKQGISVVPWQNDLFWIGSSYEWNYSHEGPTSGFRSKVEQQLANWLKLPYKIEDHFAAVRPANLERRPFVGVHPSYPNVGIFNGLGTKGCSLAPYFAKQFTDYLVNHRSIDPEADVRRFEKTLNRSIH